MNNKFSVSQIRLMRFLYALGFEKESYFDKNGRENWFFEKSDDLQKSLDFYFAMRAKQKRNVILLTKGDGVNCGKGEKI